MAVHRIFDDGRPYIVQESNIGTYLQNMKQMIVDADTIYAVACELLQFVEKHGDNIDLYNAQFLQQQEQEMEEWASSKAKKVKVNPAHVYLIKSGEYHKIGVTGNIDRRVKDLSITPYDLEVVHYTPLLDNAYEVEKRLHEHFAEYRHKGEWFSLNESKVLEAVSLMDSYSNSSTE